MRYHPSAKLDTIIDIDSFILELTYKLIGTGGSLDEIPSNAIPAVHAWLNLSYYYEKRVFQISFEWDANFKLIFILGLDKGIGFNLSITDQSATHVFREQLGLNSHPCFYALMHLNRLLIMRGHSSRVVLTRHGSCKLIFRHTQHITLSLMIRDDKLIVIGPQVSRGLSLPHGNHETTWTLGLTALMLNLARLANLYNESDFCSSDMAGIFEDLMLELNQATKLVC
jgi:hypothetical protein